MTRTPSPWVAVILFFADDEETTHRLSGNVTIHAVASETAIRSRLQAREAQQKEFLPEADILDEHTLRTDYEKLRVVFEFNQALGADIELDIVLNRILDKALEYSSADRGVILLLNEQGVPEPRASRHRRGDDEQIQLSSTILNEVLEQHHAVLATRCHDGQSIWRLSQHHYARDSQYDVCSPHGWF